MSLFQSSVRWPIRNPLAAAAVLYIAGVMSLLLYAYLEPRGQQ